MQNRYEVRVDFTDETFEVQSVVAESIAEAVGTVERDPSVVRVTLLAIIDRAPQTALAW